MFGQEKELFGLALGLIAPWTVEGVRFDAVSQRLDIVIVHGAGQGACPECGEECKVRDWRERQWRHLDFFQHECYLTCRVPRVKCGEHGVRQMTVPWSNPRSGFTLLFEAFCLMLVREMPVNPAAKILRLHDTQLWRILGSNVKRAREKCDFSGVTHLGIDETSSGKNHAYISLVADLEGRRLLFGTVGNSSGVVGEFAQDLVAHGGKPEQITDTCCDLWRGYQKGIREYLPKAQITYDRFHFIKKVNTAMDEVRRSESKANKTLKYNRFLFLRNPANLTDEQKEKLAPLRLDNTKTARAYALKLSLLEAYNYADADSAAKYLLQWVDWARRSRLKPFVTLAKSVRLNIKPITRWFESRITNGFMEGLNSSLQAARNKARGYRNPRNFITIAYFIAGKLNFAH